MTQASDPQPDSAEQASAPVSVAEFPTEPFVCPACGQMLGAECRVCVACRHVIDPAEIQAARNAALPEIAPALATDAKPLTVRYPWLLFFLVLVISFTLWMICNQIWGSEKANTVTVSVQTLAGVWAFSDALRRRIPRPLRWGVCSMLLFGIIFPWYLARRNIPKATVPFVEAEIKPVTRFLLYALITFFILSTVIYFVYGPPPK